MPYLFIWEISLDFPIIMRMSSSQRTCHTLSSTLQLAFLSHELSLVAQTLQPQICRGWRKEAHKFNTVNHISKWKVERGLQGELGGWGLALCVRGLRSNPQYCKTIPKQSTLHSHLVTPASKRYILLTDIGKGLAFKENCCRLSLGYNKRRTWELFVILVSDWVSLEVKSVTRFGCV